MQLIHTFIDIFFHLDQHLNQWAGALGIWLYVVLFLIIFCETGLVVMPYLPGDSLLFAIGALTTTEGSPISVVPITILLCVAAILGDAVNYAAGYWMGPKIFSREDSRWLSKEHLVRASRFYEKYGGKTIIFARFIPIIRTFAPFVAGIGKMSYPRFALFNVIGGIIWTVGFIGAGHLFADLPVVKTHFHYVILGIIFVSILPAIVEFVRARRVSHP